MAFLPSGILARSLALMAGGLNGRVGSTTLTNLANRIGDMAPGTVYSYPEMKRKYFDYGDLLAVLPEGSTETGWNNQTFQDEYRDALEMQDLEEHNRALNKYIRPGMTPAERQAAIKRGEQEERKLPGFWDYDRHPRRRTGAKSTAVSNVRMEGNMIKVRFGGKGKWYTYRGGANAKETSREISKLLASRSIGKSINGWWGQTHHL